MSVIDLDFKSRTPIYEQLVENVSSLVFSGIMRPNEMMPSVRQLASELGINPNTIHKAYTELERRGIIYSTPGRGSFVSEDISGISSVKQKELLAKLEKLAGEALILGIDEADATAAVHAAYESPDVRSKDFDKEDSGR